jgi:predicted extracellular nuclease
VRRLSLVWLAVVGCTVHPPVPDPDADAHVRLATFNVHRFFDTVCDSGACAPGDYEELPGAAAFEARAEQLARAIVLLDADVVALQEIETQASLDALVAHLGGALPHGAIGEIGSPASVDVAILSRTPLDYVGGYRADHPLTRPDGSTTTFSRELLEVHVQSERGEPIVLFAAHFRSKFDDDPGRRLAEAQASAAIVNDVAAAHPEALVVLGGDLNDVPGSPPLDALTVAGGLVRVADDLPVAAQATYRFNGAGQALDHLLLAPTGAAARVPVSSRVLRDGDGWGGSDHAALTSDFVFVAP